MLAILPPPPPVPPKQGPPSTQLFRRVHRPRRLGSSSATLQRNGALRPRVGYARPVRHDRCRACTGAQPPRRQVGREPHDDDHPGPAQRRAVRARAGHAGGRDRPVRRVAARVSQVRPAQPVPSPRALPPPRRRVCARGRRDAQAGSRGLPEQGHRALLAQVAAAGAGRGAHLAHLPRELWRRPGSLPRALVCRRGRPRRPGFIGAPLALRPRGHRDALQLPHRDPVPPADGRAVHGEQAHREGGLSRLRRLRAVRAPHHSLRAPADRRGHDSLRRSCDERPAARGAPRFHPLHRLVGGGREAGGGAAREDLHRGRRLRLEDSRTRRSNGRVDASVRCLAVRPGCVRVLGSEVLGAVDPLCACQLGGGGHLRQPPPACRSALSDGPHGGPDAHCEQRALPRAHETAARHPGCQGPVRRRALQGRGGGARAVRQHGADSGVRASARADQGRALDAHGALRGDERCARAGRGRQAHPHRRAVHRRRRFFACDPRPAWLQLRAVHHRDLRPLPSGDGVHRRRAGQRAARVRRHDTPPHRRRRLQRRDVCAARARRHRERHHLRRAARAHHGRAAEPLVWAGGRPARRRHRHARSHSPRVVMPPRGDPRCGAHRRGLDATAAVVSIRTMVRAPLIRLVPTTLGVGPPRPYMSEKKPARCAALSESDPDRRHTIIMPS
mmetsp:Transcript_18644/g.48008  ORF Transcript_18644/g.48008 Transcript_18644/m.48008 type:complete len:673 (+) Transcript_18644:16-2034(+)